MSPPTLTELAAPVIAMAQAHCTYLDTMRQTDTADTNRAALVAFKRALKEADKPAPTAHDAVIAEARRLAEILPLENMSAWGHKVTLIADALTAERAARMAAERDLDWHKEYKDRTEKLREGDKTLYNQALAERDAAIARAEQAEADTEDQKALLDTLQSDNTALRTQLAEAQKKADAHDMAQAHIFKNAPLDPECPATDGRLITDVQNLVRHAVRMREELAALKCRRFHVMDGPSIPWSVILPYEAQAVRNHGQTLERLAQRGGLSAVEAARVLKCQPLFERGRPDMSRDEAVSVIEEAIRRVLPAKESSDAH